MNATQSYANRRKETVTKLETLQKLLEKQDKDQAKTPHHWTHSAELGYLNSQLDELIQWMKG